MLYQPLPVKTIRKSRLLQVKTSSMGYLFKFHAGKRRLLKAFLVNMNCAIDINIVDGAEKNVLRDIVKFIMAIAQYFNGLNQYH